MTKTKTVVSTTTTMFKARHLWSRAECDVYAATSISPYDEAYRALRAQVRATTEARQREQDIDVMEMATSLTC